MYFSHLKAVTTLALSSSHIVTHLKNSDATQLASNQLVEVQRSLCILWNMLQWKSIYLKNTLQIGTELQQETFPTHAIGK